MIYLIISLAFLLGGWAIVSLFIDINKNLLKKEKMIHGYIIKKIGEDIYATLFLELGENGWKRVWAYTKFPFIFQTKETAEGTAKESGLENTEIRGIDMFIEV